MTELGMLALFLVACVGFALLIWLVSRVLTPSSQEVAQWKEEEPNPKLICYTEGCGIEWMEERVPYCVACHLKQLEQRLAELENQHERNQ